MSITSAVKDAYKFCFGYDVTNLNKDWVPHTICRACYSMLMKCHKQKDLSYLQYSTSTKWNRPDSPEDCFSCMTDVRGFNATNRRNIKYVYASSVTPPVINPTKALRGRPTKNDTESDRMEVEDVRKERNFEMELEKLS